MSIKRPVRKSRRGIGARLPVRYVCEPLEPRTLLNTVLIKGDAGTLSITLSSHSVFHFGIHYFVDWSINDVNNGQTQSAALGLTDKVMVDTGPAEVGVNVLSTIVPTTIQGDSPSDDILNLGGPNGLQGIAGPITITDTAGFWDITADDTNDTTSRAGTLSDGSLTGLSLANITWDATKCHGLAIDTSKAGGNTLNVLRTNVQTTIQGHSAGADDSLVIGSPTDGMAGITGHVTLAGPTPTTGLWHLTLNYQAENSSEWYVLHDGSIDELSGGFAQNSVTNINWSSSAVRDLTIKTPVSTTNELYELFVVNTNVPTAIIADSQYADVELGRDVHGNINGVLGITGNVYVTDLAGSAELAVWQFSDPTPRTVTLHTITVPGDSSLYGAIDGLAPATIAYRYADIRVVTVKLGQGEGQGQNAPATVQVLETETSTSVDGAAAVEVGDGGSLQKIAGPLAIDGGSVNVDDSADPTSRSATIVTEPGSVTDYDVAIEGLSPGKIQCVKGSFGINAGGGANDYTFNGLVIAEMLDIGIVLNTGTGNDTVQISGGNLTMPLVVNGQGGNDAFTVNYGNALRSNLVLDGGSGSNTLTLSGPAPDTPFSLTLGTITGPAPLGSGTPVTISYTAFKTMTLTTGTFDVGSVPGGVNLSASGPTTVKFQTIVHLGALSIGTGAQATLIGGPMPLSETLFCTGLSIASGGKFDLANNSLQLTYSGADPVATIRSYLASGYNNGTWNGNGILTSSGDATHALGLGDWADGVVSGLSANTLLVRWTRVGDVNLDGKVGFPDLISVARNYGKTGMNWDQGDLNYDGAVGFDDLIAVARNYGATAALQSAAAAFATAPLEMPIKTRRRR